MMLRFAEEVLLLLLHDDNGKFARVPEWSLRYALGGGVLMDLALENRIDTDLEKLVLIDSAPVGDSLLDPLLEEVAAAEESHDARYWVEVAAGRAWEIREEALARLIERGILEQREDRFLWVLSSRRYPVVDGKAERELKLRIMEVLFSDALPDPRDIVIIGIGGRLRDLQGVAGGTRAGPGCGTDRPGAKDGPDRPSRLQRDLGHRDRCSCGDATARVLTRRTVSQALRTVLQPGSMRRESRLRRPMRGTARPRRSGPAAPTLRNPLSACPPGFAGCRRCSAGCS